MDLNLFVQCAAKITAMNNVSFQGLTVLMFCPVETNVFCFWNCQLNGGGKKSNINLK